MAASLRRTASFRKEESFSCHAPRGIFASIWRKSLIHAGAAWFASLKLGGCELEIDVGIGLVLGEGICFLVWGCWASCCFGSGDGVFTGK